jgi:23S rRNA (guanosine2251-2'-O)-methyltransferase
VSKAERHRVAGIHAVRAALKHGAQRVHGLWFDRTRRDRRLGRLLTEARESGVTPRPVDREELDRLAPISNHQGVVAETEMPSAQGEVELDRILRGLTEPPFLLVLDGIQDPHNLGACLRSADAVSIHAVIAPKDNSVGLTPVACKVASGAAETVPFIQVTNLARTLRHLKDAYRLWLVGLAGEGEADFYAIDLKGPLALVMGGEEKGLRRLTREQCDVLARLPMRGSVESLNVSVATGIALFEIGRQRSLS